MRVKSLQTSGMLEQFPECGSVANCCHRSFDQKHLLPPGHDCFESASVLQGSSSYWGESVSHFRPVSREGFWAIVLYIGPLAPQSDCGKELGTLMK